MAYVDKGWAYNIGKFGSSGLISTAAGAASGMSGLVVAPTNMGIMTLGTLTKYLNRAYEILIDNGIDPSLLNDDTIFQILVSALGAPRYVYDAETDTLKVKIKIYKTGRKVPRVIVIDIPTSSGGAGGFGGSLLVLGGGGGNRCPCTSSIEDKD